jgi:hypothetical protein
LPRQVTGRYAGPDDCLAELAPGDPAETLLIAVEAERVLLTER